jgi:hypothetical protein
MGSTTPLRCHQEQRLPVHAPEHARKAAPIELDPLQHLTALADAHTMLVGDVGVPDSALGVDANAVRA